MEVRGNQGAMARQIWKDLQAATLETARSRKQARLDDTTTEDPLRDIPPPGPSRIQAPGKASVPARTVSRERSVAPERTPSPRPELEPGNEAQPARTSRPADASMSPALRAYRSAMSGGMVAHQWDQQA